MVEGAPLEGVWALTGLRGFESLSLRDVPFGVDDRFCAIALRPNPSGPEGSSGKRLIDEPQAMYRSQGGFSF